MAVRVRAATAVLAVCVAATGGCAGGGVEGGPMVDRIDDAISAVESHYEAPQEFFEISATETVVSVIVAVDGATAAEQAFWSPDDGLVEPVPMGPMERLTFRSGDLAFDPGSVLSGLRDELPDSEIIDFAVTAGADGAAVYDARVQSAQGGVLLVLLRGDGRILGAQAE